ncbi:MAG: hypothetical protein HQM04_05675 [Magnetococcales bacterium]|nr:hypothetical protein [Magnetococcales bacterium]MBF0114514.1 hypothetical protein [Magnetococcales bacterium]
MERLIPWLILAFVLNRSQRGGAVPPSPAGARLHVSPGRVRLRLPKGVQPDSARMMQLNRLPGLHALHLNARTGSLLIHFDPELIDTQALLAHFSPGEAMAAPAAGPEKPGKKPSPPLGVRAGELFGRALFETFARQTIERSVFTLVTTALKG